MSTSIRSWSTSAAGNNSTVAGINFAEGQLPSTVNNSARELMAQLRQWYEPDEAGWIDHAATASVNSQTVIKLAGDQTGALMPGRRVRLRGGSVAARYASVLSASFTSETTLTVAEADGSLSASMTVIGLSAVTAPSMLRRVDKLDVSATLSAGTLRTSVLDVSATLSVAGTVVMSGVRNVGGIPLSLSSNAGINFASSVTFASDIDAVGRTAFSYVGPRGVLGGQGGLWLPFFSSTASASAVMTAGGMGPAGFTWIDISLNRVVVRVVGAWASAALT